MNIQYKLINICTNDEEDYKSLEELFFKKLLTGEIDYIKLSKEYVDYLEHKRNEMQKQLAEADFPLSDYFRYGKLPKSQEITKKATARYLVKYKRFKGSQFYDELLEYIKENNINVNGDFYMDLLVGE